MTHLENVQNLMIVDHVTNFHVIDDVMDSMVVDVLGEGGSSRQVSHKGFQQPLLGNIAKKWTKTKELLQIEAKRPTT